MNFRRMNILLLTMKHMNDNKEDDYKSSRGSNDDAGKNKKDNNETKRIIQQTMMLRLRRRHLGMVETRLCVTFIGLRIVVIIFEVNVISPVVRTQNWHRHDEITTDVDQRPI